MAEPGTVDTSLLATDGNTNPNAINPLFLVAARLARAELNSAESIGLGGALLPPGGDLRHVPHVLIDGADSIGVVGAVTRVYIEQIVIAQPFLVKRADAGCCMESLGNRKISAEKPRRTRMSLPGKDL